MNYEQARQIGPTGPAPGKWNWTNANDGMSPNPFTVAPCRQPEPGKERCDHDTREEAERHHYDYERGQVRIVHIDLSTVRERRRCDVPGCSNWERYHAIWPGGYIVDSLCSRHSGADPTNGLAGPDLVHPFEPGLSVIHS